MRLKEEGLGRGDKGQSAWRQVVCLQGTGDQEAMQGPVGLQGDAGVARLQGEQAVGVRWGVASAGRVCLKGAGENEALKTCLEEKDE